MLTEYGLHISCRQAPAIDFPTARSIAQRRGGFETSAGRWLMPCPVPSHGQGRGDHNPSCSVRDGDKPGRLLLKCFGGCDTFSVLAALREAGDLGDVSRPISRVLPVRGCPRHVEVQPDPDALAIWRGAGPVSGSRALCTYWSSRGLGEAPPPSIRAGTTLHAGRILVPTLVAAVQGRDRRVIAVQELKLTTEGAKLPTPRPRMNTGRLHDGAVRLGPAGETLGLAEGVETAASAQILSGVTVWAALGADRLAAVWLPHDVRRVVIFADNDPPGREGAARAADHHRRLGREVEIRLPETGNDFNDYLRAIQAPKAHRG